MDVLLINPPAHTFELGKAIMPPLGLAMVGRAMELSGLSVKLLDCMVEQMTFADLETYLQTITPGIIGITGVTFNRFDSFDTARLAKKIHPNTPVVYGGIHATFTAQDTLEHIPEIDMIVRGEGEFTGTTVAKALLDSKDLTSIQGISYRENGVIRHNPSSPPIEDLDSLAYDIWDLLPPLERYQQTLPFLKIPSALMMTTRGCPMFCSFCSTSVMWGKQHRRRSPRAVMDEIEMLRDRYKIEGVWFFDDTLNLNKQHITELCHEFEQRKLNLKWYCEIRCNTTNRAMLDMMKAAGCYFVSFGIESVSPRILQQINKGITIEQIVQVMRDTKELDIRTKAFYLIGLPEETVEEARQTLQFIKDHRDDIDIHRLQCGVTILPGTEVERYAIEKGYHPNDFSWTTPYYSSDTLTLARDPYSPLLVQQQLTYSDLRGLKYEYLQNDRQIFSWNRVKSVSKRLFSVDGIRRGYPQKYLREAKDFVKWLCKR